MPRPPLALLLALGAALALHAPRPAAAQASHHVTVSMAGFSPEHLDIAAGDTVVWHNVDGYHDIVETTPGDDAGFGTGAGLGWTYAFVFEEVGAYTYYCSLHHFMTGSIAVAPPPPLAVALAPEDAPVVIPPEGGTFAFNVTITNGTAEPQAFEAWAEAATPGGAVVGPLVGPVALTLGPGESVSRTLRQRVPASAPAGAYNYVAYVGTYPDGPVASDAFAVVKEGVALGAGAASAPGGPAARDAGGAPVVPAASEAPLTFALHTPRPNPFTGRTALAFELPIPSHVRLVVYDAVGRAVAVLVDGPRGAGRHEVALDGAGLASGGYRAVLEARGRVASQRLTRLH